ncbi:MAG: hypothetical protein VX346_18990 [Planctomycetota bacterium]|nr:hypothetical protein [Planctomycetota bacterium]
MSVALFSLLVLIPGQHPAVSAVTPPVTVIAPRRVHDIGVEMRRLLRAQARARSDLESFRSVQQMCALFREVVHHPRWESSDRLLVYKSQLSARLRKVSQSLQRRLSRRQRAMFRRTYQPEILALTDRFAEELQWMGTTFGGPAQLVAYAQGAPETTLSGAQHLVGGGGGRATVDEGQQLIELIQRTIMPEFWDRNGGPGTIAYYAPLHALVVRATRGVHQRLEGLLEGARRGGR